MWKVSESGDDSISASRISETAIWQPYRIYVYICIYIYYIILCRVYVYFCFFKIYLNDLFIF